MGGRRNMPRKMIARVTVFLLLGAIVNVAVAWGTLISNGDRLRAGMLNADLEAIPLYSHTSPMRAEYLPDGRNVQSYPSGLSHFSGTADSTFPATHYLVVNAFEGPWLARLEVGWPRPSLRATWTSDASPPWLDTTPRLIGALRQPIWPGFAINTLFYAGILWLMFAAPFALRRRFRGGRIKRGLCSACAYPIGNSPVCTECGAPLKLPARCVVAAGNQPLNA